MFSTPKLLVAQNRPTVGPNRRKLALAAIPGARCNVQMMGLPAAFLAFQDGTHSILGRPGKVLRKFSKEFFDAKKLLAREILIHHDFAIEL